MYQEDLKPGCEELAENDPAPIHFRPITRAIDLHNLSPAPHTDRSVAILSGFSCRSQVVAGVNKKTTPVKKVVHLTTTYDEGKETAEWMQEGRWPHCSIVANGSKWK